MWAKSYWFSSKGSLYSLLCPILLTESNWNQDNTRERQKDSNIITCIQTEQTACDCPSWASNVIYWPLKTWFIPDAGCQRFCSQHSAPGRVRFLPVLRHRVTVWLGAWMTHIAETKETSSPSPNTTLWEREGSGNSVKFQGPSGWFCMFNFC